MKKILTYSEVETAKKFADEMSGVISDIVNTCADKDGEIFLSPEVNDIAIVYLKKMTEFIDEKGRLNIARVKDDASYYTAETEEDKTGIETVFLKSGITNADVNSIISAYDCVKHKIESGETDALNVNKYGCRAALCAKRLAKLLEVGAPEKITNIEKCMLMEAIAFHCLNVNDALIPMD